MEQKLDKNGLTEEEFLRGYDADRYPKPALTADIVVFREVPGSETPEVLLIRRGGHPFLGRWALPGGFAERNETLEETAARELREETGVTDTALRLVGVYSTPGRDPRGWVVSAAYAAVVSEAEAQAGDDAAALGWVPLEKDASGRLRPACGAAGPETDASGRCLAFDHDRILSDAVRQIYG